MNVFIKRIILTIILIVFVLLIQSYVFSDTCSISSQNPNISVVNYGCLENNCYFTIFNKAEIDTNPVFNSCYTGCDSSDFNERKECINQCIVNNLNAHSINLTDNLIFNSACETKKVNLELNTDLSFRMNTTTNNLSIENIDSLNTNNKDIDIYVNNNEMLGLATFNFDIPLVIISGDSNITMDTKQRSQCIGWNDYPQFVDTRDSLKILLNNLEVKEESSLFLKIEAKKNTSKCNPGRLGGEVTLDLNSIINNGSLEVELIAADSGDGGQPNQCSPSGNKKDSGFDSSPAGNSYFYLNSLDNFGDLELNVYSGNGGQGGKGSDAPAWGTGWDSPFCRGDDPGDGGQGGEAGHISFFIDTINNHNNLSFNLYSGEGGPGGDTGWDGGGNANKNEAIGGEGGRVGDIFLCKTQYNNGFQCIPEYNYFSSNIFNNGLIEFNINSGQGGKGGNKHNHINHGSSSAGDGGDGGYIKESNILFLKNLNEFNINFQSGLYGLKGDTPNGADGDSGIVNNLKIDYLINKSNKMNINLYNKRVPDNQNSSNFIINRLENGSYLPFSIKTINNLSTFDYSGCIDECETNYCQPKNCDYCNGNLECLEECSILLDCQEPEYNNCSLDCVDEFNQSNEQNNINRLININNSCYIKPPINNFDYSTSKVNINLAKNQSEITNKIPGDNSVTDNLNCSLCDYYDLEDDNDLFPNSSNKFTKIYTLYSNLSAPIEPGDLNIYYAKNTSNMGLFNSFNPFLDEELPLYTNKERITSQYNEKLKLFEYTIKPGNLKWYYNQELNLSEKLIFCHYQNYRIKGEITGNSFNFPFTPLVKQ